VRRSFARRLMLQSGLTIGGSLGLLAVLIAALLFASYVRGLNAHLTSVVARVPEALRVYRVPFADPDAAVRAIVRQVDDSGLRISAAGERERVVALGPVSRSSENATVFKRAPKSRTEPVTPQLSERLALGVATALGLQSQHREIGGVIVTVAADSADLRAIVEPYAFALLGVLLAIAVVAFAAARGLARQALHPLEEVVDALESFGAGDLRPRRVEAQGADEEFRRLAAAYNAAVEQVSAAFGERDRAELEIRRFIADAAHQLRTPLTVLQGFIGIMIKGNPATVADQARILQSMDRQSRLMASSIEKLTLLDRWRAERTNPAVVDIGQCVSSAVAPFAAAHPDREIALSVDPDCYAYVDACEIKEAVGNIVDNALKYAAPAPITVAVQRDNGEVRIVVSDRGAGLCEDERAHVFDRFYRGRQRDVTGSGLGLAIAKRAMERAGGHIELDSTPGAGTTLTIGLPQLDRVDHDTQRGGTLGIGLT
jgi:two-component system, OmpR family, sensor kinase